MATRGRWRIAGLIALAAVATGSPALADSPARPFSYKRVVPGGKYVFVMIAPKTPEEDARPFNEETAAGIREIRRLYTRSGLYRADDATEPLWTVDWYADEVEAASDAVHLVRHGPWPMFTRDGSARSGPDGDQEALSFFASGRLLRTYQIRELVDAPGRLPRSVSHFTWREDGRLDDSRSEYTLTTLDGNQFVFDIRTGEIVSKFRAGRVSEWGRWFVVGAVAAVAGAGIAWRWRNRVRVAEA